jgi:hypothetical protein
MDLPQPGRFAYAGDKLVDAYERVQWKNLELARKMEYRDGYGQRVHLRKYSDPRYTCPGSFAYMPDSFADHGGAVRATVGGGESQKHMHAKYLLQKMAGRYRFLLSRCKSCDRCHVWENGQGLSGVVLEKRRAGFAYDVALMRGGEVSVALEVWHTHKTGKRKREATRHGGVAFAEFDADEVLDMEGARGVTTLTNLEVDVVTCNQCREEKMTKERAAVKREQRAREEQAQRERDRWLYETHVGNETRMIQCLEAQVAIGHHARAWLARTVDRDKTTQLPVKSCLRLTEEYQARRHALQPESVYQSKEIMELRFELDRGRDCRDFMHVRDVGAFIQHHRREWQEIARMEKARKQKHGIKPRYEQGNSFKCICKSWMLKKHRQQYLLRNYREQCRLEKMGAFVITARDGTYCYVCSNCVGACGSCGREMLLDDCIEFGFCQECNANLFRRLSTDRNAFVHGGAFSDVRGKIGILFCDEYYDPDLERRRAVLSIRVKRLRVEREELKQREREKAAKEAAWQAEEAQRKREEAARRERAEAARREREEAARRECEEAFKARQRMQRPCRPMELKRETVQTPWQEANVVKKEPAKERKHSSEISRIASARQKKENRELAICMQSWLKPRDGRAE